MQTFLPYPDFNKSADALDVKRLGKQRIEVRQILTALRVSEDGSNAVPCGWRNHPATVAWRGCRNALVRYGVAICQEWISRGYQDTQLPIIQSFHDPALPHNDPVWLGQWAFHVSHQSNLIRKKPEYYRIFWPNVPIDLPYIWPQP